MKYLIAAIVLGAVGWYYLIDGSKLDAAMVREFYAQQSIHTYERDPEALCGMLGRGLSLRQQRTIAGKLVTQTYDKDAACKNLRDSFKFFEEMGDKAGGMLTIEYQYEIKSLEVAPDRKSATVQVSTVLKMGEEFMQIFAQSTDRLDRSWRKVELTESDEQVRMRWTPGAVVDPEKYFRSQ